MCVIDRILIKGDGKIFGSIYFDVVFRQKQAPDTHKTVIKKLRKTAHFSVRLMKKNPGETPCIDCPDAVQIHV